MGIPVQDIELRPSDFFIPIQIDAIFAARQPLDIDLGCGEGSFLVEMAKRHPERNFIGVERQISRVAKICKRAKRNNLANLRVLRAESDFFVRQMLPEGSVSRFFLLFADPWPKKRHHDRRIVQLEFLDACSRALIEAGELNIKTDHPEYFAHIVEKLSASPFFSELPWAEESGLPKTDFEHRFLRLGLPINKVRLRKAEQG